MSEFDFPYMNWIDKSLILERAKWDLDFHAKLVELEPFWEPDFDGMTPNGLYKVWCFWRNDLERYAHLKPLENAKEFLRRVPLMYLLMEGYEMLGGYPVVDTEAYDDYPDKIKIPAIYRKSS